MQNPIFMAVVIVFIVELGNFLLHYGERKMVSLTILSILNDLAVLSKKTGYLSWIDYVEKAHGEAEALLFFNQLYATMEKNKIKNQQLSQMREQLKEYLIFVNKRDKGQGQSEKGKSRP